VPVSFGLAFFLAGAERDGVAREPGAAWLVIVPELGMPAGAGPFGGTPASLAS
jgi:hypothetical protein